MLELYHKLNNRTAHNIDGKVSGPIFNLSVSVLFNPIYLSVPMGEFNDLTENV